MEKEGLSVHKDGTTKEKYRKNKLREKASLCFKNWAIVTRENGLQIIQMESARKPGSRQETSRLTRENSFVEKNMG